jgi:hypothetical protein
MAGHGSAPGRIQNAFSYIFFLLIGLTSGPFVNVSKSIFHLPHQPYRWVHLVRVSIPYQCELQTTTTNDVVFCD